MTRPGKFLVTWAVTLLAIIMIVASVNVIVDPYDLFGSPRIAGINVLKPAIKNHAALTKVYQVERAHPTTVVLGTSRVYVGINSKSLQWPASFQPVYNYGLPGTTMGRSLLRELREAWSTGHIRHVVAFLDVPAFFIPDPPARGEADELRLRYLDDGTPNGAVRLQRWRDEFLSVFTVAALIDSVQTILAQGGGDHVLNLREDGTSTNADFAEAARVEGLNSVFAQKDVYDLVAVPEFQRTLAHWQGPMPNMDIIQQMIRFCVAHDLTLTMILGSSHADQMEMFRRAGLWPRVEQIKTDLATLVAAVHSGTITAWDFVEYDRYTTEHVPPPGDMRSKIAFFWEPMHFRHALGDLMLQRVFHGTPADFGAPLTLATVAARNQAVRDQQRAYVGWRPACETNHQAVCALPDSSPAEAAK
jgi:hypothetical protein